MGNNLRDILELNHVTYKELADEIGVSVKTISRYVSGETVPRLDICIQIAVFLHVELEDIWYNSSGHF